MRPCKWNLFAAIILLMSQCTSQSNTGSAELEKQKQLKLEEKSKNDFLDDMKRNSKVYNTDSLTEALTKDTICNIVMANFNQEDTTFYIITFPPFNYKDTVSAKPYFSNFCRRHKLGYALNINRFIFIKPVKIETKEGTANVEVFYQMAPFNSPYYSELSKMPNVDQIGK